MGAGRPLSKLELSVEQNNRLSEWARRHRHSLCVRASCSVARKGPRARRWRNGWAWRCRRSASGGNGSSSSSSRAGRCAAAVTTAQYQRREW